MGVKVDVPYSVGSELVEKLGRNMRIVSEADFRKMRKATEWGSDWTRKVVSVRLKVVGGGVKKGKKR